MAAMMKITQILCYMALSALLILAHAYHNEAMWLDLSLRSYIRLNFLEWQNLLFLPNLFLNLTLFRRRGEF